MVSKLAGAFAALLLTAGAQAVAIPTAQAAPAKLPARAEILASMERMADWQLAHLDNISSYIPLARPSLSNPRDWQQATFWVALTNVADRSKSPRYRDAILAMGRAQNWQLGGRVFHADDHLIGWTWLWASRNGAGPEALAPMKARFEQILAAPPVSSLEFINPTSGDPECTIRWCWCDALFMAPPTLYALQKETGDKRYGDFAHKEYVAATDYLYDRSDHLYYRDSRFFTQRGAHGEKLYWSRGNGWVISGLARLIPVLDKKDPRRPYYIALYKQMAAKLLTLQRENGYWAPSLLGDLKTAQDESSGTGFFVHALAWGVKEGYLPRAQYMPAITKGWAALNRAIQPDGRLGWVQQVSYMPDAVAAADTQFYGVGAYLLAGSAVYDLADRK
ncbi:glycoside hydrolase family 88 protein [Sphingomonas sp. AOB5]|uniref:glycoside hydrolase family 88/105 protein n=1 Tax=Sphingomonas sp. AOB5 TaxID=3034017 RepID=UPI0023F7BB4E|nr:glycoside hydrolase family 88 protein [Sphingomonas sp. AOB5]